MMCGWLGRGRLNREGSGRQDGVQIGLENVADDTKRKLSAQQYEGNKGDKHAK
jgi:hypothetical protein